MNSCVIDTTADLRSRFFGVSLAHRALEFKFEPADETRVVVEEVATGKFCERFLLFKIAHADSAASIAHRGHMLVIVVDLLLELSVGANLTVVSSVLNITFFDMSSLAALEVPDSDALSEDSVKCSKDNWQDHDPKEHNEEVEK
jgi:hypothetical protein